MNVLSKIWEVNVMNTISKRARRLLRPIAVRLVETWRGLRIDMTNVEREARGASTPLVAGRASALREGGSGLGVETPAGSGGVRVPREARAATCGLSDALSATDSVADRAPWIVGRNCTCTKQEPFGGRVLPLQPSATLAKSPALAPPTVTLPIARGAVPALATVTVPGGAVLPTWVLPNPRGLGLTNARAVGCLVPVPWRAATCGLSDPLSATDSVADRAPWIVGRNCTCTKQELFGGRVLPLQPSATLAKSPALAPPTVTLPIARGAVPALATVTVPGGAVLPTWVLPNPRRLGLTNARAGGCLEPVPWRAATGW